MDNIPTYKEEYWEDALNTLKREERKAAWKKRLPFLLLLFLSGIISLVVLNNSLVPKAQYASSIEDRGSVLMKSTSSTEAVEREIVEANTATIQVANEIDEEIHIAQENTNQDIQKAFSSSNAGRAKEARIANSTQSETNAELPDNSRAEETEVSAISGTITETESVSDAPVGDNVTEPAKCAGIEISYANEELLKIQSVVPSNTLEQNLATDFDRTIPTLDFMRDRMNHFYLKVGNAFFTGYGRAGDGIRLNPQIGLGYYRLITDKLALSAGVNYMEISGIGHVHEVSGTSYSFGAEVSGTRFQTDKLKYLEIPVQLHLNVHRRHAIYGIAGIQYLLTVSNSLIDFNDENISVSREDNGYAEGYKNLIPQLGIGYQYRLGNNLSLGCSYFGGVADVRADGYYSNSSNNLNSRIMINLNYQIRQ